MTELPEADSGGVPGAAAVAGQTADRPNPAVGVFRVRMITAGIEVERALDIGAMQAALKFLGVARAKFAEQFDVQTVRVATQPLPYYLPSWRNAASIDVIRGLDRLVADAGALLCIGPVLVGDEEAPGFGSWAADLVQATNNTSFSSVVASAENGVHHLTVRAAAEAIAAIARTTPGGEGNFRYCASALCPPGIPFFPAAYHDGPRCFSIGLESPRVLQAALAGAAQGTDVEQSMTAELDAALASVRALAERVAHDTGWRYLGVDVSPAPGLDASIGRVIETLSGAPFGAPSTLAACATITGVLKKLTARTCGYSGLMLPVLEDRVLAQRAAEGRYGIAELLLYAGVCGTGLDVVPLPGDTSAASLAAIIGDVATLAARYRKPLSARLLPVPGKRVGEAVAFDNPYLTGSNVLAAE